MRKRFHVDGTNAHGIWTCKGKRSPWAVFDTVAQDWILETRWRAVAVIVALWRNVTG